MRRKFAFVYIGKVYMMDATFEESSYEKDSETWHMTVHRILTDKGENLVSIIMKNSNTLKLMMPFILKDSPLKIISMDFSPENREIERVAWRPFHFINADSSVHVRVLGSEGMHSEESVARATTKAIKRIMQVET